MTATARQTPPGARPNRGGWAAPARLYSRVGCKSVPATARLRGMAALESLWLLNRSRLTRRFSLFIMKATFINSATNTRVKTFASLRTRKGRREFGLFLAEGPNVLSVARSAGYEPVAVIMNIEVFDTLPAFAPNTEECFCLSPPAFKKISDTRNSQGIAAVFAFPRRAALPSVDADALFALVAYNIQDPGNMGALIRVAAAAGCDCLIAVQPCACLYSPKVVRASAGMIFSVPVFELSGNQFAGFVASNEIVTVASVVSGGEDYRSFVYPKRLALMIGNEAAGLPLEWIRNSKKVSIPMSNRCESLNASVAAGLLSFSAKNEYSRNALNSGKSEKC